MQQLTYLRLFLGLHRGSQGADEVSLVSRMTEHRRQLTSCSRSWLACSPMFVCGRRGVE